MPPRSAPVQPATSSPTATSQQPRVLSNAPSSSLARSSYPAGKKANVRSGARNRQQQQRYLPKTRVANPSRTRSLTQQTATTRTVGSPNNSHNNNNNHNSDHLSHSYDYSVPSSTEEESHSAESEKQQIENTATTATTSAYNSNPYGAYGSSSMMMPPMYMGGMMGGYGGGMGMGPFSGLYQVLYGVQNVVFSISQAVQLVGMNQQLLQQSWESLTKMVDHAIATFQEMRALELHMDRQREETEEDRQRRKRLKALRYALVVGGSWLAYKIIRHLLFHKKNRRRLTAGGSSNSYSPVNSTGFMGSLGMSPYSSSSSYYGGGAGYGSPYSSMNNNMFNGGGGYGCSSGGF